MSTEKIIDKVKKMLNLANDAGATDGERDNALRMAYKLMAKYNIEEGDLQEADSRCCVEFAITADAWARLVCNNVARLFFCKYLFCRTNVSRKDLHKFIGKRENAEAAALVAEALIKSIKRQASSIYGAANGFKGRSFCCGVEYSIAGRIEALCEQGEPDSQAGTALVLATYRSAEEVANDDWAKERFDINENYSHSQTQVDPAAARQGIVFGKNIPLSAQLEN